MLNLTFIVVYIDCKKIYKHTTPSSGHVIIFFFILFFTFHRLYNTHHFILVFLKAIFHLEDLFTFKFRDSPSADTNCREESVTFSFPAAPPCFYFEGGAANTRTTSGDVISNSTSIITFLHVRFFQNRLKVYSKLET